MQCMQFHDYLYGSNIIIVIIFNFCYAIQLLINKHQLMSAQLTSILENSCSTGHKLTPIVLLYNIASLLTVVIALSMMQQAHWVQLYIGTCSNSQHWRGSVHSVLLVVRSVASLGLLAIHAVTVILKGMFRTSKRRHQWIINNITS